MVNNTNKESYKKMIKDFNVNKNVEPEIAHLSFSDNINDHFEYMRIIAKECYGNHVYRRFNDIPRNADLYITEHFMSTRKDVDNFPYKYKNKTINVIHSMNCISKYPFLCNVISTNIWRNTLSKKGIKNLVVIPNGINLEPYKNVYPSFKNKIFGRITRWSEKKIPFWWNDMVKQILEKNKDVECLMYIDIRSNGRKLLKHERMIYDKSVKITDFKGKYLKKLSLYVHANGTFIEVMSNAILEAMATGLPIIYLNEDSTKEVIDYAGLCVNNKEELKRNILKFLNNKDLLLTYSKLSKERVKVFDIKYTVEKYNNLIRKYV
jgi:glycosyltransferase involved in cell wall biosynthesis